MNELVVAQGTELDTMVRDLVSDLDEQRIAYKLGRVNPEAAGEMILYRLEPAWEARSEWNDEAEAQAHQYVVASRASVLGMWETYLFPADEHGAITDWGELPGSTTGYVDQDDVIESIGYTVTDATEDQGQ